MIAFEDERREICEIFVGFNTTATAAAKMFLSIVRWLLLMPKNCPFFANDPPER